MSKSKRILGVLVFIAGYLAVKAAFATLKATMKSNDSSSQISLQQVVPVNQKSVPTVAFDGSSELTLPAGWRALSQGNLPKNVVFRAEHPAHQTDLLMMRLPRLPESSVPHLAVFGKELAETFAANTDMKDPKIQKTNITKVNGYAAVQYEIEGDPVKPYQIRGKSLDGSAIVVVTVLATSNSTYNIITATPKADYIQHQAAIQRVVQGFEEYGTAAFTQ